MTTDQASEKRHIAGPWECERDWLRPRKQEGAVWNIRASERGQWKTRPFIATVGTMGHSHDELEGNAHLIAAAPELLEAAKEALAALDRLNLRPEAPTASGLGSGTQVYTLLRAAIEKAEGR